MAKQTKVVTRRRKFFPVEIPLVNQTVELVGSSVDEVDGRRIKFDLTRQLKGKSTEVVIKVEKEEEEVKAYPVKLRLMPYFIRRIMRKNISYVEDSFEAKSQESLLKVKPFLITRKKVSRAVRKTLRNKARNWLEDYISGKKDSEVFGEVFSNKMQKPLSLSLKKTYPLSFCEIRILEIVRPLEKDEIPEIKVEEKEDVLEGIDQLREIEEEKKKKAEEEMKKVQEEAVEKEEEIEAEERVEIEEAEGEFKKKEDKK